MQKVKNSRQTTLVDILKCVREFGKYKNWRQALRAVAGISGQHHVQDRSVVDTIKKVVDDILRDINPMALEVTEYPIGLDSRVAEITALLTGDNIQRVHYIGIWGMGGIGKTTIAIAVFNVNCRNFEGCCFLANFSVAFGLPKGPEGLQEQLIADVLKIKRDTINNIHQGKVLIKRRLCSKKILIVVDDVNDKHQLDILRVGSFVPESVIILTTRHKDLLVGVGVKDKYQYTLKELDDADSLKLFNAHAFGDKNPSAKLLALSREILQYAGGLPLALEVFGSNLCNKSEAEWIRFIGRLKEVVNPNIQKILVISFESLDDHTLKELFLDIACLFVGYKREEIVPILGSCYEDVDASIDLLRSRCLIKTDKDNKFSMHDLVRDMGREIARQFSHKDELEKHSRIFNWKDIHEVLDDNKGTQSIECMVEHYCCYEPGRGIYDTEAFKKMPKLRFLKMVGVYFILRGSFEHIFQNLRWLHWFGCPLETLSFDFCPKKLVILELPHNNITTWSLTKDLPYLKILDLTFSRRLITIPDFSRFPCLEKINLSCCGKLKKVDTTIGDLKNLVSLNLSKCSSLHHLPESVCKLTALESLDIGYCESLKALPEELGSMKSLTSLVVGSHECITKLPDSIIHLTKLVELKLLYMDKHVTFGDTVCRMNHLKTLELISITYLPWKCCTSSVTRLSNLSNLKQLQKLKLQDCSGLTGIDGLEELTFITDLNLEGCESIKRLPNLSNLKQLETLNLNNCRSLTEIEGLEELTTITCLELEGCISIKRLPKLSNFKQLEELNLTNCSTLTEIDGLEGLTFIRHLKLEGCRLVRRLSNLSNFKKLETLILRYCSDLREMEGFEGLTSIERIDLVGCDPTTVKNILISSLFQMYSEFGNFLEISVDSFYRPDWMTHKGRGCTQVRIPSNNFSGLLIYVDCEIKNDDHIYSYTINDHNLSDLDDIPGALMAIVPTNYCIELSTDYCIELSGSCDDHISFRVEAECYHQEDKEGHCVVWVHPFYKL